MVVDRENDVGHVFCRLDTTMRATLGPPAPKHRRRGAP
jgi:hypothetical protein